MVVSRWLRRQFVRRRQCYQHPTSGFTLLELLIAMIISSVILSGLLFLVTEMLKIERRETAIDNVQRDMKRALEYVASEVSEAVYVYYPLEDSNPNDDNPPVPADGWANDDVNDVIQSLNGVNGIDLNNVVLAFWRPEFLEDADIPTTCGAQDEDCINLQNRRAFYTLVVYEVRPNAANDVWEGQSRLIRHELPKYTDPATLALTPGWPDANDDAFDGPINNTPGATVNFSTWQPNGTPQLRSAVLVDFVANPTDPDLDNADCRGSNNNLERIPPDQETSRSFFSCIRTSSTSGGENQNLEIFLRGDFEPRAGVSAALGTNALSDNSLLPTLRTGVFIQGVIGYQPPD